jgi:hypothetical protein
LDIALGFTGNPPNVLSVTTSSKVPSSNKASPLSNIIGDNNSNNNTVLNHNELWNNDTVTSTSIITALKQRDNISTKKLLTGMLSKHASTENVSKSMKLTPPRPNISVAHELKYTEINDKYAATENKVTEKPSTRSKISFHVHMKKHAVCMPQRRIMVRKHLQHDQIFQLHMEKQVRESLKY